MMIPNNADSEYIKTLLKEIAFLKQKNLALEEELDRYKNRNSRNSSTPPSHDFKKNSSKHANPGGAKSGHQVHHRKIIPEHKVDKFVACKISACPSNQAERDLRPMVLWRKKSFGTKGDPGLQFVSIVGSITQTLKKQGKRVFCFLSQALEEPEVLQTI